MYHMKHFLEVLGISWWASSVKTLTEHNFRFHDLTQARVHVIPKALLKLARVEDALEVPKAEHAYSEHYS